MSKAEEYRQRAEEAEQHADKVRDLDAQQTWRDVAQALARDGGASSAEWMVISFFSSRLIPTFCSVGCCSRMNTTGNHRDRTEFASRHTVRHPQNRSATAESSTQLSCCHGQKHMWRERGPLKPGEMQIDTRT